MLLSHSRCSRVEGRNSMKPKISVAWRRKREMLRQAESSGMAFQLEVLKGSLQNVLDTYNDNVQSARQLDDKAQKTGAFAGIFVAASFGYLKPNDISSLMNAAVHEDEQRLAFGSKMQIEAADRDAGPPADLVERGELLGGNVGAPDARAVRPGGDTDDQR